MASSTAASSRFLFAAFFILRLRVEANTCFAAGVPSGLKRVGSEAIIGRGEAVAADATADAEGAGTLNTGGAAAVAADAEAV